MPDIQFVRNKKYGTIGMGKNGWTKEVCNVSWNQKGPKLDLREWSPDYEKMSRGITLTKQEAKRLLAILAGIDFEEFDAIAIHPQEAMQVRPVHQVAAVPQQASAPVITNPAPVQSSATNPAPEPVAMSGAFPDESTEADISDMEEIPAEMLPTSV